jgi:hypothetical protein
LNDNTVLRLVRAAEKACPALTRRIYKTLWEDAPPVTNCDQAVVLSRDPQVLIPVDSDDGMDSFFHHVRLLPVPKKL